MVLQAEKEDYASSPGEASSQFETMLAGERTQLVRFCAHLTGNPGAAEDLAQETLLEAWRNQYKLHDQDDRENKGAWVMWLRAIARNVCKRWERNCSRDHTHLVPFHRYEDGTEPDTEDLVVDDHEVEIELERDELAQLLDRALALLPPVTREVLIERYIHESPHAEIAGRLGLSEDALVQRLYRGKLALRRVITAQMSEEAAAYGLSEPEEEKREQETRIWCPMCGKGRLIKCYEPPINGLSFTCSMCLRIASVPYTHIWRGLSSPRSILGRQLAWLGDYYWQAINKGVVPCYLCGQPVHAVVCCLGDTSQEYYQRGGHSSHGIHIICPNCHREEINPLSHLTLDMPEARQFWRKHSRMRWLPEHEIEYAGQAALLNSFQSVTDSARLDVIFQRETLRVLSIYEDTR